MNMEKLKMDKKEFKKLSKSKAYTDAYVPMYQYAISMIDNLEKANIALEEMRISNEKLQEAAGKTREYADKSMEAANKSQKYADDAVEWALDAENRAEIAENRANECEAKYEEAKAFQDEAILGASMLSDQINKVKEEKSEAERLKQKSDSEFCELMADTLNKKAVNKALSKLSFNAESNSDEDLEALKVVGRAIQNEMSENDRQIALNNSSMSAIKSNSINANKTAKAKELELKLLEEDYNNALKTIGELVVNGALNL